MVDRHKVFVSFHHGRDEAHRDRFKTLFSDAFEGFVDRSVQLGDIEEGLPTERIAQLIRERFLADATVTVVLIGAETWKRKYVDWEIYSSLRDTSANPRMGLLGIVLSSYTIPNSVTWSAPNEIQVTEPASARYWPYNVPQRLIDNVRARYAKIRPWPSSGTELTGWIHEAFLRRNQHPTPDLSRDRFARNRSDTDTRWY